MKFHLTLLALANSSAIAFDTVINVPPDVVPNGTTLANNTQLNVLTGGTTGMFLDMGYYAGGLDDFFPAVNIEINILGGTLGDVADFYGDVTVNMEAGQMEGFFANNGVTINMSGGTFGTVCGISGEGVPSVFNLSGGTLGGFFDVNAGATLNVSGGTLGIKLEVFGDTPEFDPFGQADHPGTLNFIGSDFAIDGVPIAGLVPGVPFTVTERGGETLTGTLTDGGSFEFYLNATGSTSLEDVLYTNAILTVTLAEPSTPPEPPRLEIVSTDPISPTERAIVLRVANAASGTPAIEQSTDLGLTDPWAPVPELSFTPISGEPGTLEATLMQPLTANRRFFRLELEANGE